MRAYEEARKHAFIIDEDLGTIEGYYDALTGTKFIHVNTDAPAWRKRFIVAYALYFAELGKDEIKISVRGHDNCPEAERFAVKLLMTGKKETFEELCRRDGVPEGEIPKLKKRVYDIMGDDYEWQK